jgi:hypothetical protein
MGDFCYNKNMPGITIHLAAANEYLKNHPEENADEFKKGAIAPDYFPDTDVSHHSRENIRNNGLSFLMGKVVLRDCLPDFDFNTAYGRGYFFHLITDHEYYLALAKDENRFAAMTYFDLKEKLYHDYLATHVFLKKKYNVELPEIAKEYDTEESAEPVVIDLDDLCDIIEWLGTLDLNKYLENI